MMKARLFAAVLLVLSAAPALAADNYLYNVLGNGGANRTITRRSVEVAPGIYADGVVTLKPDGTPTDSGGGAGGAVTNAGTFAVQNTAATPAGTALIGKVGIDQTTPGTTNRVDIGTAPTLTVNPHAVTNAGTFAVQNTAATPAGTALIGKVGIDQTTPGTTNLVSVAGEVGTTSDAPASTPSDTATLIAVMKGFWNSFLAPAPSTGTRVVLACSAATADHTLQAATARNGAMLSVEDNTDNVYIGYGTTAVSSSNHSFKVPAGGGSTPLLFGTTGTWAGEIRAMCANSTGTIYLTNGS